jgi:hypothetical protein
MNDDETNRRSDAVLIAMLDGAARSWPGRPACGWPWRSHRDAGAKVAGPSRSGGIALTKAPVSWGRSSVRSLCWWCITSPLGVRAYDASNIPAH